MLIVNCPAYVAAIEAVDRISRDILEADVKEIHPSIIVRERAAKVKAWAYVWLAAAVEQYVRGILQFLLDEITGHSPQRDQLRLSLFAIHCGDLLNSLQDVRGLTMWEKRVKLLNLIADSQPATFDSAVLPLDGRTIRPEHFDIIWQVFGFNGHSLPTGRHRAALNDLADGRNEVAHGRTDPVTFGRRKVFQDLVSLLRQIEDIIQHLATSADAYLTARAFHR